MDLSIPVMRLIPVLIIFRIWDLHGAQRNLVIHILVTACVMFTAQIGNFEIGNLIFMYL